jgi:hypothetical protein
VTTTDEGWEGKVIVVGPEPFHIRIGKAIQKHRIQHARDRGQVQLLYQLSHQRVEEILERVGGGGTQRISHNFGR